MEYFDGQVVLFGGYNGTSYLNDTWTWDGTTWTEDSGPARAARAYASMAEDTGYADGTGALVLFGGYNGTSYLGDTWTYTTAGWTQQSPATSPSARAYAAMAYDGTLAEPTLFGGYDGTKVLGDTWEYSGTNWVEQAPTPSPPARAYADHGRQLHRWPAGPVRRPVDPPPPPRPSATPGRSTRPPTPPRASPPSPPTARPR